MTPSSAGLRGRVAAVVLLGLAILLAVSVVALPFVRALGLRQEVFAARQTLEALDPGAVRRGLPAGALRGSPMFAGGTSGRASAELQTRVSELAERQAIALRSMQVLTPRRDSDVNTIAIEVAFQSEADALRNFMHAIETGLPLVIIDDFEVRALRQQGESEAGPAARTPLASSLKIRGFAVAKEAP